MPAKVAKPAPAKSNELHLTRLYDAPVEAVWGAWTDPEQVAQWWGPRGFSLTTHSKDLRPGGHWHYTMHGPDGTDYPNRTYYHEVQPREKLVYDHGGYEDRPPLFRVTVLFSESDGKTRMDMTMSLATPEAAEEIRRFIKKAGGEATWDRLAEYLEKQSTGNEQFVINRAIDAPRDAMFEMWTNPDQLAQWLPPAGFDVQFLRADIRHGGGALLLMTNNADIKMHVRFEYQKVKPPRCLIYTQHFCDEHENPARHPLAPTLPATLLTTVTLTEETPTRTRITVTMQPHGPTTHEELQSFTTARPSMTQGWTTSFDKLETYAASQPNVR